MLIFLAPIQIIFSDLQKLISSIKYFKIIYKIKKQNVSMFLLKQY